jgi:hypothetical protein
MFGRLIFSSEVADFLMTNQNNPVAKKIIFSGGFVEEGNFICIKSEERGTSLTYLPKSKYPKLEKFDAYGEKIGRTSIKPGRFIKKFFPEISEVQVDEFVNLFKSHFDQSISELKIVEGSDILKYYNQTNYHAPGLGKIGTLWNSCMRQPERNKFLKLYRDNPNQIKMLVLLTPDGRVRARALIWYGLTCLDGKTWNVLDRIYTVFDHDVPLFKKWAKERGFISKSFQNAKTEKIFDIAGEQKSLDLKCQLENWDFNYYPYLDTFKFFNQYKGTLSNSRKWSWDYCLIQSDGSLEPEPENVDED